MTCICWCAECWRINEPSANDGYNHGWFQPASGLISPADTTTLVLLSSAVCFQRGISLPA